MARLIDGDGINLALVERGQSDKRFKFGETIRYTPSEVQQIINEDMPTVDAVEVRHGEWVVSRTDFGWNSSEFPTHCKCTLCGREVPYQNRDNFCPNCGADMRETNDEKA